jgi:pimeloyl-ACP methyl ester carboxylesterase
MPYAIADGLRIYYEDLGQGGPALLLLPAWCSSACYAQLPQKCAANRRVLVFDWRGYGKSETPPGDYGADDLLSDALAVVEASGVQEFIAVSYAHSGWVAIELRRKLAERVQKIVHLEWLVLPPPKEVLDLLRALTDPENWQQTLNQLYQIWLEGEDNPELNHFMYDEMKAYGFERWSRTGREIAACYDRSGSPLEALQSLEPPVSVRHLFCHIKDTGYQKIQEDFAVTHPWFSARRLPAPAHTHFPMFEVPDEIARAIEEFVT